MKPGRLLHLLNGAGFGYCLGLTELLVSLGRCQTRRGSRNELYVETAEPPFSEAGREREGGRSHSALCLSLWKKDMRMKDGYVKPGYSLQRENM